MSPEDTSLNEAIVSSQREGVCDVHHAMSTVLSSLSTRIKRIELLGVALLAMTGGLLGKDLLLPLLMKIIAP